MESETTHNTMTPDAEDTVTPDTGDITMKSKAENAVTRDTGDITMKSKAENTVTPDAGYITMKSKAENNTEQPDTENNSVKSKTENIFEKPDSESNTMNSTNENDTTKSNIKNDSMNSEISYDPRKVIDSLKQEDKIANSKQLVKSLDHIFYDTIDGVNYHSVTEYGRFARQLPIIHDLDIRYDDVILCGYPKSGNHWIFEVVTMIIQQNTEFNERYMHLNMIEFLNVEVEKVLNAIKSPRILLSHLRCHRLPIQVVEKRPKIVYILRNPKDVAVSLYCMFQSYRLDYARYNGTFDEFFELYLKGEFFWGFWFDHVWSYEQFIKNNPEYPIFILYFEKMKQEPVKTIRDLCAFLEKPDLLAEDIAKVTEFGNFKSSLCSGKLKLIKELTNQKDKEFIFRKGQIGDWRNWLNVEQNEAFNKLFDEKMAESKLAEIIREYI